LHEANFNFFQQIFIERRKKERRIGDVLEIKKAQR